MAIIKHTVIIADEGIARLKTPDTPIINTNTLHDLATYAPVDFHMPVHRTDLGLMRGYIDAKTETILRFATDWFTIGDTISMDQNHAITFQGRSDDIMNAGGVRVSPIEVETAMALHPEVHEAACTEGRQNSDCLFLPAGT